MSAGDVVRSMTAAINARDLDAMDALVAPEYRHRTPHGALTLDELKDLNRAFFVGFPDIEWTLEGLEVEGDAVVATWHMAGTHLGRFMGRDATGRRIELTGVNVFRVGDGRILDDTPQWDFATLLDQLKDVAS